MIFEISLDPEFKSQGTEYGNCASVGEMIPSCEEDGLYYRYEYGQPQVDEMTGEQLAVDNVLLKLVPGDRYWNDSPLYILTKTTSGIKYSH